MESRNGRHGALSVLLLVFAAPLCAQLPTVDSEVPSDLVGFCRWTVQARAAHGLNRVVRDKEDPKYGTVYGGGAEDANIAWVAAAAYRHDWSRFHRHPGLRDAAFFLLDNLARIRGDGRWDDGGLGAYFGLHSFAWAVLSWVEAGDVDEGRKTVWANAVTAAADDAMLCMSENPCAGQYANPELYYLAGLAAAWRLSGREQYRAEASDALRRYEDVLFDGGGVSYFHQTSPQHGYQQMVSKSVALYWSLTEDPYALQWLRRLGPYFVNVQHASGLVTDAEQPWLKHSVYNPVNPAVPGMLAVILEDGQNRFAAEVAAKVRADNVAGRLPSFMEVNPNWYNYHHTTYAAAFLRILEGRDLPTPQPPDARRVFRDPSFAGVRSHWDAFTAAVGMRQKNDSLAGAYLADASEPMLPLDSAVDGVFAEVLCGDRSEAAPAHVRNRSRYGCLAPHPRTHFVETADFCAASCQCSLCSPYWNDLPWRPGERWPLNEVAGWAQIQHWAVWRDHLIGFCAMRCHESGGSADTADQARIRLRVRPAGKLLRVVAAAPDNVSFIYGGIKVRLVLLKQRGGFVLRDLSRGEIKESRAQATPEISMPAPWEAGDHVAVAIDIAPARSRSSVAFKQLNEAAAAVCQHPEAAHTHVWVASLTRHLRQHHLALPEGATARVFERDVKLTPPPARATFSLHGGESAVAVVKAQAELPAGRLCDALSSGWGRGEPRPARE